jgi:hypothetical protein
VVKYHNKTLQLLNIREYPLEKNADSEEYAQILQLLNTLEYPLEENAALEEYARGNGIVIPASFREWSKLDRNGILEKYSNCDPFWFSKPAIVDLDDGRKGLLFNSENQGNFDKILMLNCGEDPPVLYAWLGEEPWIEFSGSFSDCVYAQIFDWQYLPEFSQDGLANITYYGKISLKKDRCLDYLKNNFTETVKTSFIVEGDRFDEYRFYRSSEERLTVQVAEDKATSIQITGEYQLVLQLERELLQQFADDLIPVYFNSYGWLAGFLGSNIDGNELVKIAYSCIQKPDERALWQLSRCHKEKKLEDRFPTGRFPTSETNTVLGGKKWGVEIKLVEQSHSYWCIESISTCDPLA